MRGLKSSATMASQGRCRFLRSRYCPSPASHGELRALDESLALPPDVLLERHRAELAGSVGTVLEHPQDRLPLVDLERKHLYLAAPRVLELVAQLVKPGRA